MLLLTSVDKSFKSRMDVVSANSVRLIPSYFVSEEVSGLQFAKRMDCSNKTPQQCNWRTTTYTGLLNK